jgi:hypothetical protein
MKTLFTFLFVLVLFVISIFSQPAVNGDLSDTQYITLATKQNNNQGFGPNIDVTKIVYYPDVANSVLYIGLVCKLNTANLDGIGLWLDLSQLSGFAAGTNLGGSPGMHYMSGNNGTQIAFKADFEVDYMFAFNSGGSSAHCYLDAVKLVGGRTAQYLGNCGQSGSTTQNLGNDFFAESSVNFAFNNAGTTNTGFEIAIPFAQLGAGVTSAGQVNLFAFVVSSTAWFSDVTVPGNITTGNPGFNANFATMSGGAFNTGNQPLPVELISFSAKALGNRVLLNWSTATELNNYGFEILRSADKNQWSKIGFVSGNGISSSINHYTFTDNKPLNDISYYRLAQIDNDGSFSYSNIIEIKLITPQEFMLLQNYPNPFNPTTNIEWYSPVDGFISLKIYNILGYEIATIVNEYKPAGHHSVKLNADNFLLSSGIYFYEISLDGKLKNIGKMILNK